MNTQPIIGGTLYTSKRLSTVPNDNLTTGTRHYSLYALANQAVEAVRAKRHEAYVQWQADGTKESYAAYARADEAFKDLVAKRDSLQPKDTHVQGRSDPAQ